MISMDYSRDAWQEMAHAAASGHPTAIAWLWWRKFCGLWKFIGQEIADRQSNPDLAEALWKFIGQEIADRRSNPDLAEALVVARDSLDRAGADLVDYAHFIVNHATRQPEDTKLAIEGLQRAAIRYGVARRRYEAAAFAAAAELPEGRWTDDEEDVG